MSLSTATSSVPQHHSMAFLSQSTSLRLALIILNTEQRSSKGEARDLFGHLWDEASVRVCADGAANRLHDALSVERRAALRAARIPPAERRSNQLPDVITGDLDSIRPEVRACYGYTYYGYTYRGYSYLGYSYHGDTYYGFSTLRRCSSSTSSWVCPWCASRSRTRTTSRSASAGCRRSTKPRRTRRRRVRPTRSWPSVPLAAGWTSRRAVVVAV